MFSNEKGKEGYNRKDQSQPASAGRNGNESSNDVTPFRRALAQVLACMANNLIVLGDGLVMSFPTILLAALYSDPHEPLSLNDEQASWFASLALLCQPLGSIFFGLVMEPLGRKRSMILLNIPFFIGWTMIVFAESVSLLYAAIIILGFGVGCTEAPTITYIGEVCEPKYRGALIAFSMLWFQLAYLCLYGLGSVLSWRYTAAVCAGVPILTAFAVARIPETPLWLVSKGRTQSAEKALCWLRGWTQPEAVKEELNRLIEYHRIAQEELQEQAKKMSTISSGGSREILIDTRMSLKQQIIYFFRPEMRGPLFIIIWYLFFEYASGLKTMRPYFMHIFSELNIEMEPHQLTVLIAAIGLAGTIICSLIVRYSGKRSLSLISVGGCGLCTLGLALVGYLVLPGNWAVPLLLLLSLSTGLGLSPIPWMLQSELYPFHGKCVATGIASAASYVIGFIAIKSYLALEQILQLSGVFVLFTCLSLFAFIYLGVRLPETEGRTFHEIQSRFVK